MDERINVFITGPVLCKEESFSSKMRALLPGDCVRKVISKPDPLSHAHVHVITFLHLQNRFPRSAVILFPRHCCFSSSFDVSVLKNKSRAVNGRDYACRLLDVVIHV